MTRIIEHFKILYKKSNMNKLHSMLRNRIYIKYYIYFLALPLFIAVVVSNNHCFSCSNSFFNGPNSGLTI